MRRVADYLSGDRLLQADMAKQTKKGAVLLSAQRRDPKCDTTWGDLGELFAQLHAVINYLDVTV
jgi:hypothetical protein